MGKLYQQNKNICQALLKAVNPLIKTYKESKWGYVIFDDYYYDLMLEVKGFISYSDPVWEEWDNKLFLMIKPGMHITSYCCNVDEDLTDLKGILVDYIQRTYDSCPYSKKASKTIDDMCKDAQCFKDELINNANGKIKKGPIENFLVPKFKKVISEIINSKIEININPKLFPKLNNRTKVPFIIYDTISDEVRYIDGSYEYFSVAKGIVYSMKATNTRSPWSFINYSREQDLSLLSYLPTNRWLILKPERHNNLEIKIRL